MAAGQPGLKLTNLDRVLWPKTGFTKGQLLDYYARVSAALLAHLADRPLTLGEVSGGSRRPRVRANRVPRRPREELDFTL
jgi:bifunctional non-homologous end joining protein LigD